MFHAGNAFSTMHCNEARTPNVVVNGSHDATRRPLYAQSWIMLQPLFYP